MSAGSTSNIHQQVLVANHRFHLWRITEAPSGCTMLLWIWWCCRKKVGVLGKWWEHGEHELKMTGHYLETARASKYMYNMYIYSYIYYIYNIIYIYYIYNTIYIYIYHILYILYIISIIIYIYIYIILYILYIYYIIYIYILYTHIIHILYIIYIQLKPGKPKYIQVKIR